MKKDYICVMGRVTDSGDEWGMIVGFPIDPEEDKGINKAFQKARDYIKDNWPVWRERYEYSIDGKRF